MADPVHNIHISSAEFIKSAIVPKDWPETQEVEIAFCGRSNVGKSTLLNLLLQRKNMARVSKAPGRTRLLNFFQVHLLYKEKENQAEADVVYTDLPGFGYAQVSFEERSSWQSMVENYFTKREHLRVVVLLFDSRRVLDLDKKPDILQEEQDLFFFLQSLDKKVIPVMTKLDKLSKSEVKPAIFLLQRKLGKKPLLCSSLTRDGVLELQLRIWKSISLPHEPQVSAID